MAGGEKQFENRIKKYLDLKGCYYIKHFANAYTRSGVADILACVNGYFVAIEVKDVKGKPSELQRWNRKKVRESKGISIILYPEQFEDFKKMIDDLISNDFKCNDQKKFDKE